jgi:hypothetical protein
LPQIVLIDGWRPSHGFGGFYSDFSQPSFSHCHRPPALHHLQGRRTALWSRSDAGNPASKESIRLSNPASYRDPLSCGRVSDDVVECAP